jgi:UDP-N-acetylmuramoyl-tripeptide--D-alanyl-D-alanine ligase
VDADLFYSFKTEWEKQQLPKSVLTIKFGDRSIQASGKFLGYPSASSLAQSYLCGRALGVTDEQFVEAVQNFENEPSRLNSLKGKGGSVLIDDSYNASPASVTAALDLITTSPHSRKILFLGEMRELGSISKSAHEALGQRLLKDFNDSEIFLIGSQMKLAFDLLQNHGKTLKVRWYNQSTEVELQDLNLNEDSIVLVKGSQGIRMEKITVSLLSDISEKFKVCRQYGNWLKS